jgi:hypothetical protein
MRRRRLHTAGAALFHGECIEFGSMKQHCLRPRRGPVGGRIFTPQE